MDCRIDFDKLFDFKQEHAARMLTLAFAPDGATINGVHVPSTNALFRSYACSTPCSYSIEDCLLDFYQDLDGLTFHLSYDAAACSFRVAQD